MVKYNILTKILYYLKKQNFWTIFFGIASVIATVFAILSYFQNKQEYPKIVEKINYQENDSCAYPESKKLNFVYFVECNPEFIIKTTFLPISFVSKEATNVDVSFEYEIVTTSIPMLNTKNSEQQRYGNKSHLVHDFGNLKPGKEYPVLDTLWLAPSDRIADPFSYALIKRTSKECDTLSINVFCVHKYTDYSKDLILSATKDSHPIIKKILDNNPTYLIDTQTYGGSIFANIVKVELLPANYLWHNDFIMNHTPLDKKSAMETFKKRSNHKFSPLPQKEAWYTQLWKFLKRHHLLTPILLTIGTAISKAFKKKE